MNNNNDTAERCKHLTIRYCKASGRWTIYICTACGEAIYR